MDKNTVIGPMNWDEAKAKLHEGFFVECESWPKGTVAYYYKSSRRETYAYSEPGEKVKAIPEAFIKSESPYHAMTREAGFDRLISNQNTKNEATETKESSIMRSGGGISIDPELCDGCGLCEPYCPYGNIWEHPSDSRYVVDRAFCLSFCNTSDDCPAEPVCPVGAITQL